MPRIAIVDDSLFLANKIKNYLETQGHEIVGIADDGITGFELYKTASPDLITLDITMPNRDGFECLKDILVFNPDANVIVISAIDEQAVIVDCINKGAKGFIEKPLQLKSEVFCQDFNQTVNDALE
ncbi:MAG: two-component system response regulator [Gammaproteobacteria bacterium]|nr:MAG: two-component system response regulator [Gammaproteobacteria bacterium]